MSKTSKDGFNGQKRKRQENKKIRGAKYYEQYRVGKLEKQLKNALRTCDIDELTSIEI